MRCHMLVTSVGSDQDASPDVVVRSVTEFI